MQWLARLVEQIEKEYPDGEVLIESGVSPSGTYHVGTLREVLTCDAIMLELKRRGRSARHIHYVDDLDPLRKIPVNVPPEFEKYLGRPYCDVPSPDGSDQSYGAYFLNDFLGAAKQLHMDMDVIRSHEKYRAGDMSEVIEKALLSIAEIRSILEEISGRQLPEDWAPVQIMEDEYLKNRRFVSIDPAAKTITYLDADDNQKSVSYTDGQVKLNWRVDWPARWSMLNVQVEPFGRDHATKGGSYDTGAEIVRKVFGATPPYPVPYNFINLAGETKKMSKSTGQIIAISDLTKVMPPEVVRFFTLRYSPDKLLFFDPDEGITKLIDDYAALLAKPDKTEDDQRLIDICSVGTDTTVSSIPFSHLVASYQASLKDPAKTLEVIARTEYGETVSKQGELIKKELAFIDNWLESWAPEDVKFELSQSVNVGDFSDQEKQLFAKLADKIEAAPADADGEWFHKAIYELKDEFGIEPKDLFISLYKLLIGKTSGPRAGWFLSILPRDWLLNRLRLEA